MFRATMCPSSEETTIYMRRLVFVTLCRLLSGTKVHPHRVTNTTCRNDTLVSPDDGHTVARKKVQKRNKDTKKNCEPSWLSFQDYKRMNGQQNIKFGYTI